MSIPRPVLRALALLFAAASVLYTLGWLYYVRAEPEAYLGVVIEDDAPSLGRLSFVDEQSAASRAGLRQADRIVAINGRMLSNLHPFFDAVTRGRPGDRVSLLVERPGERAPIAMGVVLGRRAPTGTPSVGRRIIGEILSAYPLLFLIVGLAVLFQRLEDRNAWLLALMFAGFIASAPWWEERMHPRLRVFALSYVIVFGGAGLLPAVFYYFFAVFPNSSPIDRRFPWLKATALLVVAVVTPLLLFKAVAGPDAFALTGLAARTLTIYSFGLLGLGLVSLIWNSVRSPTAEARRKTRVMVWGTVAACTPAFVLQGAAIYTDTAFTEFPFPVWSSTVLALLLLPVSFAYAVLKYRVLEIPVLLKRSARYLLVQRGFVVLLLSLSIVATLLFALFFRRFLSAGSDAAFPAGAAFGIVLAWAGAQSRKRVTRRIDRAFFRSAYDARQILEDLAERSRSATDRQELATLLERCVTQALHPSFLLIYLQGGAGTLDLARGDAPPHLQRLPNDTPWLEEVSGRGRPTMLPPPDPAGTAPAPLAPVPADCLVPMPARDRRLLGLLVLGPRRSEEPYSREDQRLLMSVASQAGVALENISLAETIAERMEAERRAAHEIEIAREVQQKLFPQKSPSLATLEYAGACIQARVVGGDYYDFLDLGPGRVGLVLADIAGKGISAALLMANLQANLRSQYVVALGDPARLLHSVNRLFYESAAPNRFASLFFGRYEDATRRLTYVNCGHNPPLVLRRDDSIELLHPTAPVLGLFDEWSCSVGQVELQRGDTLVVYSDGVTEAWSDEGEEFGEPRLIGAIRAHRRLPAPALLEAIVAEVRRFSGRDQEDDVTLLVAHAR